MLIIFANLSTCGSDADLEARLEGDFSLDDAPDARCRFREVATFFAEPGVVFFALLPFFGVAEDAADSSSFSSSSVLMSFTSASSGCFSCPL
mmetsp:Transcript_129650/g.375506  ORF Transcript_129650/g.375506 Transcript_129650/m.375506 type:complete len:92 (-) Transcript_129650:285-560(-)